MKGFYFIIFLFSISNLWSANEQSNDSLFYYGVLALSDHDYEVAIGLLEKDVITNLPTFEAYYNLSQAYAAIEDWNNAYFSAERALKFSPNSTVAKENVRYTLSNLNNEISFVHPYSWLQRFVFSISSLLWFIIGIIASIISAYFIFLYLSKSKKTNSKSAVILIIAMIVSVSSYFAGVFRNEQITNYSFVLASQNNTSTFASKNGIELNQLLVQGQRYSIIEEQDEWIKLAYPDGQPVWVKKEYLLLY